MDQQLLIVGYGFQIKTAVSFLANPNVQKSPASQKELFLKKKGLTVDEIRIAFERADNQLAALPQAHHVRIVEPVQQQIVQVPLLQRIRDVLNTVALLAGVTYGLIYLYKVSFTVV